MIDGVCGGIAEYFDLDPTLVRVVWVLFTFLGGTGILLYIAAMIVMPANPNPFAGTPYQPYGTPVVPEPNQAFPHQAGRNKVEHRRFWGIVLILVGALILMTNLGWFAFFDWFHFSWELAFPIMLIILGSWFMFVYLRQPTAPQSGAADSPAAGGAADSATSPGPQQAAYAPKVLRRSITNRKLFGVCGGIAKYFDVDATIVRVVYIMLVLASFGWGLLLYIILAFLLPEERFTEFH